MKPTAQLFYIVLFFSFMLFQTQAIAQKTPLSATSTSNQINELKQIREDIASLKNAVKEINNNLSKTKENPLDTKYIEILEKTNQQLASSWVPTSVSIAILEALIALIAIGAVILIYRQSEDFRAKQDQDRKTYNDRLDQDRSEQKKALEDYLESQKSIIEERNKQAEKVEEKINEIMTEYEKKLQATTGEQKEEISRALLELKRQKATLQRDIGGLSATTAVPFLTSVSLECPKCKYRFRDTPLKLLGHTCPKCGTVFGLYDPQPKLF